MAEIILTIADEKVQLIESQLRENLGLVGWIEGAIEGKYQSCLKRSDPVFAAKASEAAAKREVAELKEAMENAERQLQTMQNEIDQLRAL